MAELINTKLGIKHEFDARAKRHFLNGVQSVYHCHHYTALYTQLAIDAGETTLLSATAEECFYDILVQYYTKNEIKDYQSRADIACQYYSAIGMGLLELEHIGDNSGVFVSKKSHLEEGWIKKWSNYDKPVNYIGCGYVSAMMSAILDKPLGTFVTSETESIVKGSEKTVFNTHKK